MKKKTAVFYLFFCLFLLLCALPVIAGENADNRVVLGFTATRSFLSEDAGQDFTVFSPSFTYERLFVCIPDDGTSLTGEITACINPFKKNYSLSLAVKAYMGGRMKGWYLGVAPLSDFNFYDLFAEKSRVRYGLGFVGGGVLAISRNFDLEIKANWSVFFDTTVPLKIAVSWNFGYRF